LVGLKIFIGFGFGEACGSFRRTLEYGEAPALERRWLAWRRSVLP